MGLKITDEQKAEFRTFCRECLVDESSRFCLCHHDEFMRTTDDGGPLWEFHASNYNPETSHDIYELFQDVTDEFTIEVNGYDEFYVTELHKDSVSTSK